MSDPVPHAGASPEARPPRPEECEGCRRGLPINSHGRHWYRTASLANGVVELPHTAAPVSARVPLSEAPAAPTPSEPRDDDSVRCVRCGKIWGDHYDGDFCFGIHGAETDDPNQFTPAAVSPDAPEPRPESEPDWTRHRFATWFAENCPPGTIIGDPAWWATRIERFFAAAPRPAGPTPERLPHAIEYAATRFELLAGRFRACHESLDGHDHRLSIEESEAFASETREAVESLRTALASARSALDAKDAELDEVHRKVRNVELAATIALKNEKEAGKKAVGLWQAALAGNVEELNRSAEIIRSLQSAFVEAKRREEALQAERDDLMRAISLAHENLVFDANANEPSSRVDFATEILAEAWNNGARAARSAVSRDTPGKWLDGSAVRDVVENVNAYDRLDPASRAVSRGEADNG